MQDYVLINPVNVQKSARNSSERFKTKLLIKRKGCGIRGNNGIELQNFKAELFSF